MKLDSTRWIKQKWISRSERPSSLTSFERDSLEEQPRLEYESPVTLSCRAFLLTLTKRVMGLNLLFLGIFEKSGSTLRCFRVKK